MKTSHFEEVLIGLVASTAAPALGRGTMANQLKMALIETFRLSSLCARSRYVADGVVNTSISGRSVVFGHITDYSESSHASKDLSSFHTGRRRAPAEIPEGGWQACTAASLARNVNSA